MWATPEEWESIAEVLFERGIIGPIEDEDVATFDGEMILNGAFGVEKAHDPPVILEDGSEAPALRLILNLIPSNACQLSIDGDIAELPACGQLCATVLAKDETLLWSSADRKCFFYIFRLPAAWWPWMALTGKVPGRCVGCPERGRVRVAARVVGMGWLPAVGITQHLHRNLLRHAQQLPRGMPWSAEMTRRSGCPMSTTQSSAAAWMVYIDNLEVFEALPHAEAEELRGSIPLWLEAALDNYDFTWAVGNPSKDVHRASQVTTLGEFIDGVRGTRSAPPGYLSDLVLLTLCTIGRPRVSRKLAQIVLGRWVRVQCFRRPTVAAFHFAWQWLSGGGPRLGFSRGVIEDLLIAIALAPCTTGTSGSTSTRSWRPRMLRRQQEPFAPRRS